MRESEREREEEEKEFSLRGGREKRVRVTLWALYRLCTIEKSLPNKPRFDLGPKQFV